MNRTRWVLILILNALIWSCNLYAQADWPMQHVDKRSGLSNSAVNAIYMDHRDYVWFGSWDGLNRYDGNEIESYKPVTEDSLSISNNIVRQILEDKNRNLWVVTHNGINRYDRGLNQFLRYFNNLKDIPFLENNLKATLSEDSSLYISLVGWGVGKYNSDKKEFEPVNLPQASKNIHNVGVHDGVVYAIDDRGSLFTTARDKGPTKLSWSPNIHFQRFVTINNR
ncbi:MAG: two-component regulator propeller domain-containing protein, partial [Cyclobacteriaceae bacterium]